MSAMRSPSSKGALLGTETTNDGPEKRPPVTNQNNGNGTRADAKRAALNPSLDTSACQEIIEDLSEASEKLRTLVDASPLAIIALDVNGLVTIWNHAAEEMFGWTADVALGHTPPPRRRRETRGIQPAAKAYPGRRNDY